MFKSLCALSRLLAKISVLSYILFASNCDRPPIDFDLSPLRQCVAHEERCLIVLSVATKNIAADSFQTYTDGLKQFGYDFHIIGTNRNWKGWVTRGLSMQDALAKIEEEFTAQELNKIIIATSDTGDVVVQRGPRELLDQFEKKLIAIRDQFGTKLRTNDLVIVGGEWFCYGNCDARVRTWYERLGIDESKRIFPHAQGGFLMGPVTAAKRFYDYTVEFMLSRRNDDQIAMANFAIDHPQYIYIDYQQELAATIVDFFSPGRPPIEGFDYSEANTYEFADKGLALSKAVQQIIGSAETIYPSFLHVPGNTRAGYVKTYWDKLVAHIKQKAWQ